MIRLILMIVCSLSGAGMLSVGALAQINGNQPLLATGATLEGNALMPVGALITGGASIGLAFGAGVFFATQKVKTAAIKTTCDNREAVCLEGNERLRAVVDQQYGDIQAMRERVTKLEMKLKAAFRQIDQLSQRAAG